MKFRKKPVVIEAHQFDGTYECMKQLNALFPEMQTRSVQFHIAHNYAYNWKIGTLEKGHIVNDGDWIIKDSNGEFYPCNPDIFVKTYDPVPDKAPFVLQPGQVKIFGIDKAAGFKRICNESELVKEGKKILKNPMTGDYYDFAKYLWVEYPDDRENVRLHKNMLRSIKNRK